MPFVLGRFIFPGIKKKKKKQPHLSSWDLEKKEETNETEKAFYYLNILKKNPLKLLLTLPN